MQNRVKIISCTNPILWYNDKIGETYNVSYETSTAYWVRVEGNLVAWVYKNDTEFV